MANQEEDGGLEGIEDELTKEDKLELLDDYHDEQELMIARVMMTPITM